MAEANRLSIFPVHIKAETENERRRLGKPEAGEIAVAHSSQEIEPR
jgi:hypothetical protein